MMMIRRLLTTSACAASRRMGQPVFATHPFLIKEDEITPGITLNEVAQRRQRLMAQLPTCSILIASANPRQVFSADIPFAYRPNSNMAYLSGCTEPSAALVIIKDSNAVTKTALFVREHDEKREVWDGPVTGVADAPTLFGVDEAYPISKLRSELDRAMQMDLPSNQRLMVVFERSMGCINGEPHSLAFAASTVIDLLSEASVHCDIGWLSQYVDEMRSEKSSAEQALLRRAADASAHGYAKVMRMSGAGVSEHAVAATMEYVCRMAGARCAAFPPVVAAGANATILHYVENQSRMYDGQLLLVDSGSEFDGYTSDVTRTWPVGPQGFSRAQRLVYEAVLAVQKNALALCVADGISSLATVHEASLQMMQRELSDRVFADERAAQSAVWTALTGGAPDATLVSRQLTETLYPHHVGHYLGMDLHDTPSIETHTPFRPGMVITVEPGLYFPSRLPPFIPAPFHGIGIRIEDNVIIRHDGEPPEVITSDIPKDVSDIESITKRL